MNKRGKSLYKTVTMLMVTVLLCMLAVQAVFLLNYSRVMAEKSVSSLEAIARQTAGALNYELDSIRTSGVSLFRNEKITDLLTGAGLENGRETRMALDEVMGLNSSVDALYLTKTDWEPVAFSAKSGADREAVEELFAQVCWSMANPELGSTGFPACQAAGEDGTVYFAYVQGVIYREERFDVNVVPDNGETRLIGYAVFICHLNAIAGAAPADGGDYDLLICHGDKVIFPGGGSFGRTGGAEVLALDRLDLSGRVSRQQLLEDEDWSVTALMDKAALSREILGMTLLMGGLLFLVTVAAIAAVGLYLNRNMLRPIRRMERELMIVSDSDPSQRLSPGPDNEIGQIGGKINLMLDRLDVAKRSAMKAQQEKYEGEILQRKAELNYIHAQVNPHFLYNSLETVCGMAAMHRDDLVIDTCTALSALFRYSIRETDWVCFEEELKYARNYFYVMNQRYRGELELRIDVGEENRGVMVPKMILQPVLENSLKHGRLKELAHGQVSVSARRSQDCFVITVRDNGAGIPPERLEALNAYIRGGNSGEEIEKVGLRNLCTRLRMSCGEGSGIFLESQEGVYTQVQMIIALEQKD
ncbi:MAG: sensor histidine kinase [Oscillospiraceae bacterium]